jgi:hypothetical protein
MKTKFVIKSLADIPAEVVLVKGASSGSSRIETSSNNPASGSPEALPFAPPGLYTSRDPRLFGPQPWPRGGLNE